ncbi:MAG: prolyl oligopeptidase family serine peptidase [Pyrinomonadaceae bacterium]
MAQVDNVTDDYFGVKVIDPYRWMEDLQSKETQNWIKAQATYADDYLQKLPMRDEILKRLTEVSSASVQVGSIQQRGNVFFYLRRAPDEQDLKLYVRQGLTGAERLLVDPNKVFNDGKRYSLGAWNISFDGKYVSYNIAAGGAENGEIRVVETATGRDTGERIDRIRNSSVSWLADNKSFLYTRLQKLPADAPASEKYQRRRVYLHILGTNSDEDKPVFGNEVSPDIKIEPALTARALTNPNWKYVFAAVNSTVSPNSEYYVAPIEALGQARIRWRKIVSFDDKVSALDVRGEDLHLLTYKNTPRYKIIRTSISKPELKSAETVFTGGEAVVQNFAAQPDAFYIQTLDGGNRRIHRVDYKTKKAVPLKIPYDGAAIIAATESNTDGIYYNIVSWTKSPAHFKYNPKTQKSTPTNLIPPNPVDMSHIEFTNAKAKSHDGVMIPLVIVHKKGLKLDGANPTLMSGYGAYGIQRTSPDFDTNALPWFERGGVIVLTGVRGGGEYGAEWHEAGKQQTKPNTWKDFIACAEYLIKEKYTAPRHLGINGGSAGGILISNAIATRPELFGAAIISNGLNNTLRLETTVIGAANVPEFGSVKTEEGFRALLAMDGYLKIKDGVKYPAVLLTTGINDPRVPPWMSAKTAARVQAASASGKPVLLRIDYDAGHGGGTTKEQINREIADIFAFLFQQLQ